MKKFCKKMLPCDDTKNFNQSFFELIAELIIEVIFLSTDQGLLFLQFKSSIKYINQMQWFSS